MNLDETDFSPPSSTFLDNLTNTKRTTNLIKSKPIVNTPTNSNASKQPPLPLKKPSLSFRPTPQSQSSLSIKNGLPPPSLKPSAPILKQTKPINSLPNTRTVPPVPPRKSSIPRPALKPQPPQRNSSTNLLLRKTHVSHL